MPAYTTLVAIWNCTMADGWSDRPMAQRIAALQDAVGRAVTKAGTLPAIDRAQPVRCIFTAPEYAFADPDVVGMGKPAMQTSLDHVATLINTAKALTPVNGGLLLIPGTVAYREPVARGYDRAWNGAFAMYGGAFKTRFEKRTGVGEVSPTDTASARRLHFTGGVGYGDFELDGVRYGLEICRDATLGGTLPMAVDVHVVMAGSAGNKVIHDKGTQYLIVADPGECRVLMRKRRQPKAEGTEVGLHGATIHYYSIVLEKTG